MVLLADISLTIQAANWRRGETGRLGSSAVAGGLTPARLKPAPISANSVPLRIMRIPRAVASRPAAQVCGGGRTPQDEMLAIRCQHYPDRRAGLHDDPGERPRLTVGWSRGEGYGQPLIIHVEFRQRTRNRRDTRCYCRTAILAIRMLYFRLTGGFASSKSNRADRPERDVFP
jgi:hypothetical protein